jgi:hypothetical protein
MTLAIETSQCCWNSNDSSFKVVNQCSSSVPRSPKKQKPEVTPSKDTDLECLVCMELRPDARMTVWCKKIICAQWGSQLDSWPYRCNSGPKYLAFNIELSRKLRQLQTSCKICGIKCQLGEIATHHRECKRKAFKDTVNVLILHRNRLVKTDFYANWKCEGPGETHMDEGYKEAFTCKGCNYKVCFECAQLLWEDDIGKPKFQSHRCIFVDPV